MVPCYNFTKYIGAKHDEYLDGNLSSLTHEAMMSMAKCKFDFLKTKEKWGAESPDDKKIVAMAAEIKSLKGQLKLDPELSTIAGKGDKGDDRKNTKKKNKKNMENKKEQKKDEAWKKESPKVGESKPDLPPRLPRPSQRSHVVLLLGHDNRSDIGMATPGASSQCSSQEIQVFQETEEEND